MKNVNKAIIIGRLGAAPELGKHGEKPVCNFSVATSERWKDKQSGETRERTEWHDVTVWGALADICFQSLAKGSKVYVEGVMKSSEWTDKDDVKRRSHFIEANDVSFLDDKDKSAAG